MPEDLISLLLIPLKSHPALSSYSWTLYIFVATNTKKHPQSSPKTTWTLKPSWSPTNQQNHNTSMGEVLTCFYKRA